MKQNPPNARFWAWHRGSWVKITLRPGQSLHCFYSSRDEEGWSSELEEWNHEGDIIVRNWANDGRDCDGRLSHSGRDKCLLVNLRRIQAYHDPTAGATGRLAWLDERGRRIYRPDWQKVSRMQRDYASEAMGY